MVYNRTSLTIIHKQPYIDWANSFEDTEKYDDPHVTTILIPDEYYEFKNSGCTPKRY